MWLDDKSCFDTVHIGWNQQVTGSPSLKHHSRIQNVKNALKLWNTNHFRNCHKKIKELKIHIESVQNLDKSANNIAIDAALQVELDIWLARVETFWWQRSKDKWLKDGDANTKYFHLSTILHARNNRISSIKSMNNMIFFERNSIGNCFVKFYSDLFTSDFNPNHPPFPADLENLFPSILNNNDNIDLCEIHSHALIKKILFFFATNKSPGPDGLPPTFFKNFWKTTKKALIEAIQHFFKTGHLLKALNCTFIALIPKGKKASRVDQLRPISLCNVTYKTISKILACRLKSHLNRFISPFQMAFVLGRNIHDNIIISHEVMHYLHHKSGSKGFMAIKIDLTKAFDKVEWSLVLKILNLLGFSNQFVNLIQECISSPSFSFLINGSPFGNLRPSRGIRQGDPISPFLFVIYIELLSRMLAKEEQATTEDALCIKNVLEKFSICLGFKECNHKAKHLGLPFCHPKSRKDSFTDVFDKISSNLSGWKSKNLSQASRTILLKAVAQAIPSYTMSVSLIPKGICNMMDAKLRKFWWGENCNENSLMLKTWDSICSPKSSGGLGFRRMFDLNKALFSKITWNVAANSDKLWVLSRKANQSANTHWKSQITSHTSTKSSPNLSWIPPPFDWLKINNDSSFDDGIAHSSCIIRNSNGSILLAHSTAHVCLEALAAEALAVLEACKILSSARIKNAIFEADSLDAISFIVSDSCPVHWTAKVVIEEIKKFSGLWPKWRFKYGSRNSNFVAHSLAKWVCCSNWDGIVPPDLIPLVCFGDGGHPLVDSFISCP
ncbi:PREDICTED: uncharacterized protein LOC105970524 [Erythranthe guttata]|uniref:uncharacterized protein LOC105970524 n=1 Tax=Erythranthe guttata TaxID=4155 RepID=UPI00064DBA8A|nr:PREDICTED: uncharacterized protein LOC105970524 [Erythranthe guttata]|eukprot:XP_012850814.1 PREDICTED: uncharacterized protein LOC105970524 [Erythranthe guttata]